MWIFGGGIIVGTFISANTDLISLCQRRVLINQYKVPLIAALHWSLSVRGSLVSQEFGAMPARIIRNYKKRIQLKGLSTKLCDRELNDCLIF